jgi:hypothetical protein
MSVVGYAAPKRVVEKLSVFVSLCDLPLACHLSFCFEVNFSLVRVAYSLAE